MQQLLLKIQGLYTHPSDLSEVPPGALAVADNIVINSESIAEPRRGYDRLPFWFSNPANRAQKLHFYQSQVLASYATNLLAYYNPASGWTNLTGTYSAPTGAQIRAAQAKQNLYLTTSSGVYKLDAYNSTPKLAGSVKALGMTSSISASTAVWLTNNWRVAYRAVWGYKDANSNLILGTPSQRESIKNISGALKAIDLKVAIPAGVDATWFVQIYRSGAIDCSVTDSEPNDELGLVYETNPTSTDLTNGYLTITDITPDALRGATIYTAATQEGLANGNERPPLAQDIAIYKDTMFYANTKSKHRKYVTLLGAGGTNGLQLGDTITVGGIIYTAAATANTATATFALTTSGSASQNIHDTTISLVQVVNGYYPTTTASTTNGSTTVTVVAATNIVVGMPLSGPGIPAGATVTAVSGTTVTISNAATATGSGVTVTFSPSAYAYYMSGPADLPGQILFEERGIGGTGFSVATTRTGAWSPNLGNDANSTNDQFKNGLFYSKTSEPEAVPLGNFFFVGSAQEPILRILPLRDSLFIFKTEGIYRLSGVDPTSFQVALFDSSSILIAPETAVVLNNQIFCLTDQGVVSVTESGVQVRSRPIENTLLTILGNNPTVMKSGSFGVAYESDRKYILFVPATPSDTTPTQAYVFNTFTNTWTRWLLSQTCGGLNPADDKLYFGNSNDNYISVERKSYSFRDYVDYGFSTNVTAITGTTLSILEADQVNVGDIFFQSSTVYAIVTATNPTANAITVNFNPGFTLGTASVLHAISSAIAWVPLTSNNPGVLKQFREVTLLYKADFVGTGTITFTSDISPSQEIEVVQGTPLGQWGLFGWGSVTWGGDKTRRPIRVYVPRNKQRSSQLNVKFQAATGYTQFQLNGLSVITNNGSERVDS